jgi:hypothetical protein
VTRSLFDADASEAGKVAGMGRAAESRASLLDLARPIAVYIALSRPTREVTADDVQRGLVELGYSPHALGNAAGSLFKGKEWEWTGKFIKSERVHSHSNLLRVWRYVG